MKSNNLYKTNSVNGKKLFRYFLFVLALQIFTQITANAATFTVANTNDGGAGSLRQAIVDANATIADDTILFNIAGCPNDVCTITLTSNTLSIQSASTQGKLTISNSTGASKLIISGNDANRVIQVNAGADFILDGVTITNGKPLSTNNNGFGGGILIFDAVVTVLNSVITNNAATRRGGGIFHNAGTLNIINSSLVNNSATGSGAIGGGIANFGNLVLTDSTVNNNSAITTDTLSSNGGGIVSAGGSLTVTKSTVSGNVSSSGGGIWSSRGLTITNSTISRNSGFGVTDDGSLNTTTSIRNTIIAANTTVSGQPGDIANISDRTIVSKGNNLIGSTVNTGFTTITWQASDILNQSARLAPLGNYGGATRTQPPLPGSPAVNAGNNCVLTANGCGAGDPLVPLTLDQRGLARVGTVDIGAVELQANENPNKIRFDFDGDGRADLSVFRSSESRWYIQQSALGFRVHSFGLATDTPVPADYDGDGFTDVAVWRSGAALTAGFYIFQSSNSTVRFEQFGQTGDNPALAADYDGDGKADPAVYRESSQSNFYYRGSLNNPNGNTTYISWGTTGDKPASGDYNGDGKNDFAIFRNGQWWILQNGSATFQVVNWGISGDKLVQSDYDGDGKTDLAVFRSGTWYILQSANNSPRFQQWGLSTDVVVPADYDGDGKTDTSVFRNGVWYILQSASSSVQYANFGLSTDTPVASVFVQ